MGRNPNNKYQYYVDRKGLPLYYALDTTTNTLLSSFADSRSWGLLSKDGWKHIESRVNSGVLVPISEEEAPQPGSVRHRLGT